MDRFNRTGGLSKASNGPTPVPAARTNQVNKQDPISSGLLISVIKTLTSTVSDDQRQLERSRLEKGYEDSGLVIDRLLDEHQSDVSDCMNSFRKVSNGITNCRERIHNVKNALHTCKSLLQCRRDDLKKLWMESAEQRYMNNILQQIHEMKHMDQTIEQFVRNTKYCEAVGALKRADILLNGPLSQIDGLNQLRTNVTETSQTLFEKIVQDLLHSIVVVPFDIQNLELMKSIGDSVINESVVCVTIIARYACGVNSTGGGPSSTLPSHLLPIIASHQQRSDLAGASSSNYGATSKSNTSVNSEETSVLLSKINESLEALKVFDQLDSAVENILSKSTQICIRSINDSIALLRLIIKDGVADSSHLAQLVQVVIHQMRGAASRFALLTKELQRIKPSTGEMTPPKLLARFWETMQTVFETLLSNHLDICRSSNICSKSNYVEGSRPAGEDGEGEQEVVHRKNLFSFENTSFSSTSNSSLLKKKQLNLLCPSTPYNITAIFHLLNRFRNEIEKQLQEANGLTVKDEDQPCRSTFFSTLL
uniref:Exocyst complex component Sec8 n=1 Tax=Ditylenchus dipsaci TaxID=166011 RepID=A0A915D1Q5_9BILA